MASVGSTSGRIGVYNSLYELRDDGSRSSWADTSKMAQEAERIGFDSIWFSDRLDEGEFGVWESTTMVSAVAAITNKITIGTAVTRSIYRNPALLAKVATGIDEISGGRFVLGLGAGSDEGDNRRFGYPEDHPVSRFEEALGITHTLLRTGSSTHTGRYYQTEDAIIRPRGPSPDGPPIMISAAGPRMMRLAAKYADYWNSLTIKTTPEGWQPQLDALEVACAKENRDPATLRKIGAVLVTQMPGIDHPFGESLSGTPEQIAGAIQRFFDHGFDEIILYPAPVSSEAVSALEPVVEILKS